MKTADSIVRVAHVDLRMEPYDWAFAREDTARIDAHWAMRRQANPGLFDGRVLMMHKLDIADGCLRGACFETAYRSFLGWRELGFPGAPVANGFAMAALQAADGAFMLGEMNAGTASAGRLYFPAGTPEPSDIDADGRLDLAGNVLRELEEETGLSSDDVSVDTDWTVVIANPFVACMKLIRSPETAAELRRRLALFNATQPDPELADLVPIFSRADYRCDRMPPFMIRFLDWAFAAADQPR